MPVPKSKDRVVLTYLEGLLLAITSNFIQAFVFAEVSFFPRYYGTVPIVLRLFVVVLIEIPLATLFFYLGRYTPSGIFGLSHMYPLMKGFYYLTALVNPLIVWLQRYPIMMMMWFSHIYNLKEDERYIFKECLPASQWICVARKEAETTKCCDFVTVLKNCTEGMSYPLMEQYERYITDYNINRRPHTPIFTVYFLWTLTGILIVGLNSPPVACILAGFALSFNWILLFSDLWDCGAYYYAWPTVLSFLLIRRASLIETLGILVPLIRISWCMTTASIPIFLYIGRRLEPSVNPLKISLIISLHRTIFAVFGLLRRGCISACLAFSYNKPMQCMMEPTNHEILYSRSLQLVDNTFENGAKWFKSSLYMFAIINWYEGCKVFHMYILVDQFVGLNSLLSSLHIRWLLMCIMAFSFHWIHTLIIRTVNLKLVPILKVAIDTCLIMELWILIVGLFWGFGEDRVIATLEYANKTRLPKGFRTLILIMPYITTAVAVILGIEYQGFLNKIPIPELRRVSILVPLSFLGLIALLTIAMILTYILKGGTLRELLNPTKRWGPVRPAARRYQLYFNPRACNYVDDPFHLNDHLCLLDDPWILKKDDQVGKILQNVPEQLLEMRIRTPRDDLKRKITRLIKNANADLW